MNQEDEISDDLEEEKSNSPKKQTNIKQIKPNFSKKSTFSDKISLDYIFSYETNKELNVLDR